MNTNRLAQMYGTLSTWERFRLSLDAAGRNDEQELQRLLAASPWEWRQSRDFERLFWALEKTAAEYTSRQLDLVAILYWAKAESFYWGKANLLDVTKAAEKLENRLWAMHRLFAFCVLRLVEAWRLFCKELQLDPDELLDVGLATIRLAEETSRQTAFSADEALAYVCEHCPTLEGIARLTAQDEAHGLRRLFEAELAKWGAPSTANAGPRPG
jgi:hypothetical protein